MYKIIDIKGNGFESAWVNTSFHDGKDFLKRQGYKMLSFRENAELRMQEGVESFVSQFGNYVDGAYISFPSNKEYGKENGFLTRKLPMILNKRNFECYYELNEKDFLNNFDKNSEDVMAVPEFDYKFEVPTNRFGEDDVTSFVFQDLAQKYGDFLNDAGVSKIEYHFSDSDHSHSKFTATPLWLTGLGYVSGIGDNIFGHISTPEYFQHVSKIIRGIKKL